MSVNIGQTSVTKLKSTVQGTCEVCAQPAVIHCVDPELPGHGLICNPCLPTVLTADRVLARVSGLSRPQK